MFFDRDIKGDRLPPRTLCLTYDDGPGETAGDGPGPHTPALGQYLAEQGIAATFFVIGRHADGHADLLRRLRDWGHLVANHTYSHPGLVGVATAGGDVADEVARTDEIIREHVAGDGVLLRPPYGNWRETQGQGGAADRPTSVVAEALNRSPRLRHCVGPVNWDVSAQDYDHWRRGAPAAECAAAYLAKIDRLGRGLVLMHDSAEEEALRRNNRTLEATRLIVPALKAKGYRFVRLDAVPQVRSAVRVSDQVRLRAGDGKFLAWEAGGGDAVVLTADPEGGGEVFGVVALGGRGVALRAGNGQYLSVAAGGGEVRAAGPAVGARECLEVEELAGDEVALRTAAGLYFVRAPGHGPVRAAGTSRRGAAVFHRQRRYD